METPFNKDNNKSLRISQDDVATIKNALAIISGYAQLLLREPELTVDQKEKLQEIVNQTFRIAELVPKKE